MTEPAGQPVKTIRRRIGLWVMLGIAILVPVLSLTFSHVDYRRAEERKSPIFCIPTLAMPDGGSVRWYGLGYRLTVMHRIIETSNGRVTAYMAGPVLEYWAPVWPFTNKEHTWLTSE